MATIYDQAIAHATKIILKISSRELSSLGYNERVFNSTKINIPKLDLGQIKVQIKQEEISFRNTPIGISFPMNGNRTIEYAIYSIPINGDIELFASIIRRYIDRRTTYIEYKNLYYKEYSNDQISGNDELINQIKNRVMDFITNVNANLKQFENEVDNFHNAKLKPTIDEFIQSEIEKRNLTSDSESKLNPFT